MIARHVDHLLCDPGRHENSRNADAEAIKGVFGVLIVGRDRWRRDDVIGKSTVFVVQNDQ